ncbi:uncharacterized protein SPAPADRAFT_154530 [Spathaspora passalidarum NRRL Y-27907]|uniref:Nucleolar complex protein 14 n=1 Tax=Spathaspora passalidarum (strain NRRL Y-27907 / 11-Y1) TaxID=619300 RepID=G3AQ64_SPAPN|nr:uncharacterized protein SPAPADRAFT_154530 [Spathaspora passalidarum NRRL Y-27907]EGW31411.1 hypothetical protein SPAPADRAFT_154530 [Spathaspora passalidarum NRRL Y-27907]
MAGSQLKQLKAALKEKGLIGQTNTKSKKSKHNKAEVKRDDRQHKIDEVRNEFNKFDTKINRTKHDVSIIQQGKFVKMGSKQHNETSARNGAVLKTMKMQYNLEKGRRGKTGGILDKRFGESDKHLSKEEKMLARFTKERQNASRKRNAFSLESDEEDEDDDEDGFTLTHSGQALSLDDEPSVKYVDEDYSVEDEQEQPARKKSKNEVMKEIIAKSKFYKQQRQKEFAKTQDEIDVLDDEFGDVMDDLRNVQTATPVFSTKSAESIEYDSKVRELTYDRRAVPADRTKTQEELIKEHEDKLKKLEADRLRRMEGFVDSREAEADDLDDEFWAGGSDEDEEQGFAIKEDGGDDSESESEDEHSGRPKTVKTPPVIMPYTHHEFEQEVSQIEPAKQANHINKIIQAYKPNLAQGNKEKMNNFVGILFQHVLHLANHDQEFQHIVEIVKKLAETYNEKLVGTIREEISHIQSRILKHHLRKSDLVFFVVIGYLFSTSDHYHLIVTPCLILMNELLTSIIYSPNTNVQTIGQGIFTVDVLLSYQRFAKRFDPEVVNFIEYAMLQLIPEPKKMTGLDKILSSKTESRFSVSKTEQINTGIISIKQLFKEEGELKSQLLVKLVDIMDKLVSLYKEKSCLIEILDSFIPILKHLVKYFAASIPNLSSTLTKFTKLQSNLVKSRKPLTLQHHRALAMATFAPKFEENFNPDKKSYDVNKERADLNKIKYQIKMEKKAALKDIRQENKFVAREQIAEKKSMYDEYHKKMANIVNSISTIEGAEKNQYEREKKLRKNK